MRALQDNSKFIWLTSMLAQKKARLASLWGKLAILDSSGKRKPGLGQKFHDLLHQIEDECEKEFDIVCEIQNLEEKHRTRREQKRLENADPDFYAVEKLKVRTGLCDFMAFLRGTDGRDLVHEKQELRHD